MKNYAKILSSIDLSETKEVPLLRNISDYNRELNKRINSIKKVRKRRTEELTQISSSCIRNDENEKVSSNITSTVLMVIITSFSTYYGLFAISYSYLEQLFSPVTFYLIVGALGAFFVMLFIHGIYRKNFGRTQFFIYFMIYSVTSVLGVVLAIITLYPITSYQIINTYIYIVGIQLFIFIISVPITRKLVCRSDIEHNNSDIRF